MPEALQDIAHSLQASEWGGASGGGYILSIHGTVAEQGMTILEGNLSIFIKEMDGVRIETVQLTVDEEALSLS